MNGLPNWMGNLPDSTTSPPPRPDAPEYHDWLKAQQERNSKPAWKKVAIAAQRAGLINREQAAQLVEGASEPPAFYIPGQEPKHLRPEASRPDMAFSEGRRGVPANQNSGYPEHWQSQGWQQAARDATARMDAMTQPVFNEPTNKSASPGPNLPSRQGGSLQLGDRSLRIDW